MTQPKSKQGNPPTSPTVEKWRKEKVSPTAYHSWMRSHYGTPQVCENPHCKGRSKIYEWCVKTGKTWSRNRDDWFRFCRSCHRKYDLTAGKKDKAVENLWWKRGIKNPGSNKNVQNLWWKKDKQKMEEYYANKSLEK